MGDRKITKVVRSWSGKIIKLCNPKKPWSPVKKAQVISEIKKGTHRYYFILDGREADICVEGTPPREYLTAYPEKKTQAL